MMTISKQDIIKTLVIIWFVATTGYVIYDIYEGYKIRGIKAAYEAGYAESIDQLIKESEKGCQPIDVNKADKKIQLVNAQCMQSAEQAQAQQGTGNQKK